MDDISIQYQKALRCFFLTKYSISFNRCIQTIAKLPQMGDDPIMENFRFDLWMLALNIVAASPNVRPSSEQAMAFLAYNANAGDSHKEFCSTLWNSLSKSFQSAGNIDPRLVSAYLLLTLKLHMPELGRIAAEQWYSDLSDALLEMLSNLRESPNALYQAVIDTVEVYVTRLLPVLGDYVSAKTFVEYNTLIQSNRKQKWLAAINEQQDESLREKLKKMEQEKKMQEMRLAEERARRKAAKIKNTLSNVPTQLTKPVRGAEFTPPLSSPSSVDTVPEPRTPIIPENYEPELSRPSVNQSLVLVKSWIHHLTSSSRTTVYVAIISILFALLGLLRGQLVSPKLRFIMSRIWQTVQMGTKLTYM